MQGNNPNPDLRPHVIGNSYGCSSAEGCSAIAFGRAVEALRNAGIFMSVSAGNDGPRCSTVNSPPATEPLVFSVGATTSTDSLASFSSRGPAYYQNNYYIKPEISAPGVNIRGAYPRDRYTSLSGTSMASPLVGALVVLMTANCPCIARDVTQIEKIIKETAAPKFISSGPFCGNDSATSRPNNHFGWGRIDALAAVKMCQKICSAAQ